MVLYKDINQFGHLLIKTKNIINARHIMHITSDYPLKLRYFKISSNFQRFYSLSYNRIKNV
jgi:predicted metalloenzyme YecM